MYIEVPDMLAARKGKNRQEFGLEHHHVFSIQSLDGMINKSGLMTLEIKRKTSTTAHIENQIHARK